MGYEVYLTPNSIGSNSEEARRECMAYSITKKGRNFGKQTLKGSTMLKGSSHKALETWFMLCFDNVLLWV